MTLEMILLLVFWLICSILSYGFSFAYYQNEYSCIAKQDYASNIIMSLQFSLFGPFALLAIIFLKDYKYGLKFR